MKTIDVKSNEYVTKCKKCNKVLVYTKEDTKTCYVQNYWEVIPHHWEVSITCPCGNKIIVEKA